MGDTSIEWTRSDDGTEGKTWNPVTGCTKVSAGCKHCYAERVFPRAYGKERKFNDVICHEDRLAQPLHWKKPRRIFVNSMSDLFHEDVPDDFLNRAFSNVMEIATQHTFQILTKRPSRMLEYLSWRWGEGRIPMRNIWIGVSVEDQKTADERIPLLLQTPAAVRFVSYEPALGPVNFTQIPIPNSGTGLHECDPIVTMNVLRRASVFAPHLDWIIVGGESGPGARPFDLVWASSVIEQCKTADVACFVKQLGAFPMVRKENGCGEEWPAYTQFEPYNTHWRVRLEDRKGGDMFAWPERFRVRKFPT